MKNTQTMAKRALLNTAIKTVYAGVDFDYDFQTSKENDNAKVGSTTNNGYTFSNIK
jgi:hypothetical protein